MNIFDCCNGSSTLMNQRETIMSENQTRAALVRKFDNMKDKLKQPKNKEQIKLSKLNETKMQPSQPSQRNINQNKVLFQVPRIQLVPDQPQKILQQRPGNQQHIHIASSSRRDNIKSERIIASMKCLPVQIQPKPQLTNYPIHVRQIKNNFLQVPQPRPIANSTHCIVAPPKVFFMDEKKETNQNLVQSTRSIQPSVKSITISVKRIEDIEFKKTQSVCDQQSFHQDQMSEVIEGGEKLFLSHLVSTDEKFLDNNYQDSLAYRRKTCPREYLAQLNVI